MIEDIPVCPKCGVTIYVVPRGAVGRFVCVGCGKDWTVESRSAISRGGSG